MFFVYFIDLWWTENPVVCFIVSLESTKIEREYLLHPVAETFRKIPHQVR